MSFISIEFLILISIVLILVAFIKVSILRKLIVLIASCIFYAWWDWRFLGLLVTVTLLDYYISVFLVSTKKENKRKILLLISIFVNLGLLGFFKYYNFFVNSIDSITSLLGWRIGTLNIILPIGISFYTFETLSYVIDVFRGTAQPARSLLDYAIFITFFPRLVAGPIMRASQFLPQLERGIQLNLPNIIEGGQLFLRGMLKKLVIADNVAIMVDQIYKSPSLFSSMTVWLAILAYSVQILCDFWGYTDMARGIGKMLGIDLPKNFDLPYASQSVTEFWNRWHISLSKWLRDYLYIPLGGNRKGKIRTYINLMITMLLGGLWHGASWNFVLWGGLHGLYLSIEKYILGSKPKLYSWQSPIAFFRAIFIFFLISITWVPFRSTEWSTTLVIFQKLLFVEYQYNLEWYYIWAVIAVPMVFLGGLVMSRFEWKWPVFNYYEAYTPAFMLFELLIVYFFVPSNSSPFIYFQF